ncbi:MAG: hypothetical protein PWP45_900 [Tepidanaerobacteraceae bacterium]|nr:hypothetical protein [Tepidanaerobacteraceae bacterium]
MSFIRDLVEGIYRQDEYSLLYLLLMSNVLSLAVFLSRDSSLKSAPRELNAGEREKSALLNKTLKTPSEEAELPAKKAVAVTASGGIELSAQGKQFEQSQKEKVIDLGKVRSKPLVWRFPDN